MTRRAGPTLEGSLAEWQAGEVEIDDWFHEKVRRLAWGTIPATLIATGTTVCVGYGKSKLEDVFGSEDAAMIMTKIVLLAIPLGLTVMGVLFMMGMHIADDVPPIFTDVVEPFGPREPPSDGKTWEEWLYEGVRVGRWQSLDGSGRAGAVARIPIMDEHIFCAARSRMGKSTFEWAIMEDLEEAIKAKVVRIVLFDPKNGMEMATAVPLGYVAEEDFYFGEDVGEIDPETGQLEPGGMIYEETFIKPLEDLVQIMRKRGDKIRFKDRRHHAKPGDPHIIIMIDEAAQLMRETTPSKIKNRILNAILTLEHQGAACGITVIACTQHPSVDEVGPIRHGLTFGLCGKVKSARAVDMVLGEESRRRGSKADKLPRKIPGVFYTSESGPMVLRMCYSGPVFDDPDGPGPEESRVVVPEEDQEQAERMWRRMSSRKGALTKAA